MITESFGYYPSNHASAGRRHWHENGLGKRTYSAYDLLGRQTHQWGSGSYPLQYVYNQYGDFQQLLTYREGDASLWDGATLPGGFAAIAPDTTTWVYDDASGRLLEKLDAENKGPTYAYYDSGLLHTRTWQRGVVTTYTHTSAGALAGTSYSDGTPGSSRTYRRDGSVATMTDAAGTTTFSHANPGGAASSETISGGLLDGLQLDYPADATLPGNQRGSFTATLGGATVSSMSYGYQRGRLLTVDESGIGMSATYGYAPNSDLIQTITVAGQGGSTALTNTRSYDGLNRLDTITATDGAGAAIVSHDYTYNDGHQRTRNDREDGSHWSYGYNDRGEVTGSGKFLAGGAPLAGWQQGYGYDNIGNRKWAEEGGDATGAGLRRSTYTPNAVNQYASITNPGAFQVTGRANQAASVTVNGDAVSRQGDNWHIEIDGIENDFGAKYVPVSIQGERTGVGVPDGQGNPQEVVTKREANRFVAPLVVTPTYDDDGNLTGDGRWTYTWNGENRLIRLETGPAAAQAGVPVERHHYDYDSRGRRIRKRIENWDPALGAYVEVKNERFIYDDWNPVAVVDAAGAELQRYAWGTDLSGTMQGAGGVGGLLAASDSGANRSWGYAYDGNGNISAIIDLASGAVARYDYDGFGKVLAEYGDPELLGVNDFGFSTKLEDESGMLYYGFRYYMPETGRWASRDPIGERGGVNLYGFVANDGVGGWDVLGEFPAYPRIGTMAPGINCMGHACGIPGNFQVDDQVSLGGALEQLGWQCEEVDSSKDCKCDCGEERALMAYFYLTNQWGEGWYDWEPERQQGYVNHVTRPFGDTDFWDLPVGERNPAMDYHLIRRNCDAKEGEDEWDFVPAEFEDPDDPNVGPWPIADPDGYFASDSGVRVLAKRCCKKKNE